MLHILQQLENNQGLIHRPKRGVLRIFGHEAKDFLARMCTQNLTNLSKENPLLISFITHHGRMVEYGAIFSLGHNDFVLITSDKDNSKLHAWLKKFHFIEELDFDIDFKADLAIVVATNYQMAKPAVLLGGAIKWGEEDYGIYLTTYGQDLNNCHEIDDDAWQTIRIMAQLPNLPEEINDNFMPHNINLDSSVAFDKGCYVGQEVVLKSFKQKRQKFLQGLILSKNEWEQLKVGLSITYSSGQTVNITSRAPYYVADMPCALGISLRFLS